MKVQVQTAAQTVTQPAMALVQVHSASVLLGRVDALRSVSLSIAPGECVAVIGGNGSGKSTLLRLLYGLTPPSTGAIHSSGRTRQAFVFQRPFMLRASVVANVALASWLQGVPWQQSKRQAWQALADVGLQDLGYRQARSLSGGQQQRLAFARAWVIQPQLLILDEPTASLSPAAKQDIEILMQRCVQRGITLIFASHNLGQVKRLASRVICLDTGRVVADMSAHDFFNTQLPPLAAQFVQGEQA